MGRPGTPVQYGVSDMFASNALGLGVPGQGRSSHDRGSTGGVQDRTLSSYGSGAAVQSGDAPRSRGPFERFLSTDKLIERMNFYAHRLGQHDDGGPLVLTTISDTAGKDESILMRLMGEAKRRLNS